MRNVELGVRNEVSQCRDMACRVLSVARLKNLDNRMWNVE